MRNLTNEDLMLVSGAGRRGGGGGGGLSIGDILSGNNVLNGNSVNVLSGNFSGNRYSRSETSGCCEQDHGCSGRGD